MADTNDLGTQTATQQPSKVGKIERVTMTFPQETSTDNNAENQAAIVNNEGANATSGANNGAAASNSAAPAPTITDDQLKEYFKSQGIDYEGVERLKEQLKPKDISIEPTEEEKKVKELAKEKRIVDKFISGGGTYDQYTALKNVANADVAELSKNTLKKELKDAGFSETEVDGIIKERYYQFGDEDLEQFDEETDKAFAKRKKEYGDKLLSNRSLPIKNKAAGILADIQNAIDSEDLQAKQEITLSAKIDEDFKVLPRKMLIEIGEIGGKNVQPVDYDISETDLAEVKAILKDPAQRQQLLFNQDGTLNTTKLTDLLVKAKAFDSAAKISFHSGMTKAIADFQTVFPARSAQEIGIGGNSQRPNGQQNDKPFSVGKVQKIQPQLPR